MIVCAVLPIKRQIPPPVATSLATSSDFIGEIYLLPAGNIWQH